MAINKLALTFALVLLIAGIIGPLATEAIACKQVAASLGPCLNYLRKGGSPTNGCCNGVKNLNNAANTRMARQQTCNCLKTLYKQMKGIQVGQAKALAGKCNIKISYNIDPSTNCQNLG